MLFICVTYKFIPHSRLDLVGCNETKTALITSLDRVHSPASQPRNKKSHLLFSAKLMFQEDFTTLFGFLASQPRISWCILLLPIAIAHCFYGATLASPSGLTETKRLSPPLQLTESLFGHCVYDNLQSKHGHSRFLFLVILDALLLALLPFGRS